MAPLCLLPCSAPLVAPNPPRSPLCEPQLRRNLRALKSAVSPMLSVVSRLSPAQARRSRHFAGTRYLKRGVNDFGHVANEVETEQIVDAGRPYRNGAPRAASAVQVRGSIPLFWSQEMSTLSPKPDVLLQRFDPFYAATRAHFRGLEERYGRPVVALSLIKTHEKRPREMILRRELGTAIEALNAAAAGGEEITYCHWDFSARAKLHGSAVLKELQEVCRGALALTGLFVTGAPRRSAAAVGSIAGVCRSLGWWRYPPAGGGGEGGGAGRGAGAWAEEGAAAGGASGVSAASGGSGSGVAGVAAAAAAATAGVRSWPQGRKRAAAVPPPRSAADVRFFRSLAD